MLRRDPDVSVASTALSTLCVFDAFATPRAPPIHITTRGVCAGETGDNATVLTASALMQGMNKSRIEIAASKEAQKDTRMTKSEKKSKKRAMNEKAKNAAINVDTQSQSYPKRVDKGEAAAYSESQINSTHGRDSDEAVERDENSFEIRSLPCDTTNSAELIEDGSHDHQDEHQNIISDQRINGIDASMVDERAECKEQTNVDEDSDDSMNDFPDIVDKDPDDEDKL
jgi:hypothetical protein